MFNYKKILTLQIAFFLAVLGVAGYYAGKMVYEANLKPPLSSSSAAISQPAISTNDVPENVVQKVTDSVSGVAGLDEMVVLPAKGGSGYSVTAQIDLGSNVVNSTDASDKIQTETSKYFTGIFSSKENVVNAEVYFLVNGQIVASAGLGKVAYGELTARTGTSPFDLTASLQTMPMKTGAGAENSWFEIGNMG